MTDRYRNGEVWNVLDQGRPVLDRAVTYEVALMLGAARTRQTQRSVELVALRVVLTVPFPGGTVLVRGGLEDAIDVEPACLAALPSRETSVLAEASIDGEPR